MKHFLSRDGDESKPLAVAAGNPLLKTNQVQTVDLEDLAGPTLLLRPKRSAVREMRDLRRRETAAQAIAGLTHGNELYGFTKGQFSLLDLLIALLDLTGPATLALSTWTAARTEIQAIDGLVKAGKLLSMRWLVDFTFARRDPAAANQIRLTFGLDAIRVAQNHSKFAVIENEAWRIVLRTSMNLNMNPRFEDFTIAHDPDLADFLQAMLNAIWNKQKRSLADSTPGDIRRFFNWEM